MRLTLGLIALAVLTSPAVAQDMLIRGGTIYTGDDVNPTAEVVVVEDGRIAFVGKAADQPAVSSTVPTIDLKGATLFPGFTDGHAHLDGIGWRELTLNLEGSTSIAEAMQRLADWAEAHPEGVIVGRGWIETHWPEGRFLHALDLEAAAPGRVVLLGRSDGHAVVVSPSAMEAAGIDDQTVAPEGGEILKDNQGQPTGMLVDAAERLVADLYPTQDEAARREAYRAAYKAYARYGWTGLHNMGIGMEDVALVSAMPPTERPLRLYNAIHQGEADALFEAGASASDDGLVVTRAIKVYADGALGSRGAALFEPYSDRHDTTGLMQIDAATALPIYERALREGIQIATHAIGDRGNASVLDWYMEAMQEVQPDSRAIRDPRWRIEHAQIVRPRDEMVFAGLGVIPSMQPSHAIGDLHFAPARLGDARLDGAYAWQDFVDLGLPVVGGSDAPVERGDPLIEFYAAVARRDLSGFQGPDWRPMQAVSRETALAMFTSAPAYASFREDELGTIEVGKLADFTAFDIDLMTVPEAEIPKGHAVLTVVGGEVAYRAGGL